MNRAMSARTMTLTALPGIPLVEPGDNLPSILFGAIRSAGISPRDGDVVVVAQKIVSKAEDRYINLAMIEPSPRALELAAVVGKDARLVEVILSESTEIVRYRKDVLIVAHRLGFIMANAGVDQSNIATGQDDARVLLLPIDPDASAAQLKRALDAAFGFEFGVVINDSFGRPWRNGITGVAIGAAGIPALRSMIGKPDLFGRTMQVTEIAVADEIAAAASLLMGQADEGLPAVYMCGFVCDAPAVTAAALIRPKEQDLFR
jgi:coenzyme F420-0:L-glutamate ligase/coenzyme F420-1:gamma-L-glutamate ligase